MQRRTLYPGLSVGDASTTHVQRVGVEQAYCHSADQNFVLEAMNWGSLQSWGMGVAATNWLATVWLLKQNTLFIGNIFDALSIHPANEEDLAFDLGRNCTIKAIFGCYISLGCLVYNVLHCVILSHSPVRGESSCSQLIHSFALVVLHQERYSDRA